MAIRTLSPEDLAVVKSTVLCGPIGDELLHSVLAGSMLHEYKRHDHLFLAGNPATTLHIVLEGWVKLSREEEDGSFTMIAAFSKGDSIAEAAAFLSQPYPATAQAMSQVRTLAIEGSKFLDNMLVNKAVLGAGLAAIYRQLHFLIDEIESLKSRTIRQRVVEFLLKQLGHGSNTRVVQLPYDKSLIAAKVGTSPENLSRTFAELRDYGVRLDGRSAHIENVELLEVLLTR